MSLTSKTKRKLNKMAIVEKSEKFYIYGIFQEDKCLYIGQTTNFDRRKEEHIKGLMYGTHENKSLQKYYNKKPCIEMKKLVEVSTNNTIMIFFVEALVNSIFKPKANKVIMMQGRSRIVLQRCEGDLAQILVDAIVKYYGGNINY